MPLDHEQVIMLGKCIADGIAAGLENIQPIPELIADMPVDLYDDIVSSSFSFELPIEIPRLDYLSLIYGRKITNNWLKLHGGVMVRQAYTRRRK